jgi:surface protein
MTLGLKYKSGGVWTDAVGDGDSGSTPEPYVRPADWLALPTVNDGDQKFVGLHAVYDHESNFVAVNCAGAYTVDWGDGVVEDIATGVQANHNYVYSALSSGTLSTRGYRQAVVTITPQAGQNLTTVNLFVKHNQSGLNSLGTVTGWLDIRMAGSLVSSLGLSDSFGTIVRHRMLEQFEYVGTSAIATCANKFHSCSNLRSVIGTAWTGSVTNMTSMFNACSSLQTVPLFNTAAVTLMNSTFTGCSLLQTVPLFNTAGVTDMGSMFNGCSSLQTVPLFNTVAVTVMSSMFNACSSLQTVPLFNTAAVTLMNSMFNTCHSLQTVPLFNTAAVTNMSSMFETCRSLQTVPLFNTAAVTLMTSMLSNCHSLQTVPLFNTASVTNMNTMFNGCSSLQTVPLFNTASVTSMTSMFNSCPSLRVGALSGTNVSISYASCSLSPAALDAIYTNLASGVTAQTITVTGNWGVATDTPSIATAKGWTVTG